MTSNVVALIKHGTAYAYMKHRCRCAECREAEVERQRQWRDRLRAGKVVHRGRAANCVPVRIRGKDYPSIAVAARKLGVLPSTISSLLRRHGHAEDAGLGYSGRSRRFIPQNRRPCRIHGRDFPSIIAAARHMGVSGSYLSRSLKQGISPAYSQYLLRKLMIADAACAKKRPGAAA